MSLGRMEVAALKRMEKSLNPLKRKMEKLDEKILSLVNERNEVEGQYGKIVDVMDTYAGGDYRAVLHPEEEEVAVEATVEGAVDEQEAVVDMVESTEEEKEVAQEELEAAPWQ